MYLRQPDMTEYCHMARLPERQHTVKNAPPTPAGAAFIDLLDRVVRLMRHFTNAGERLARPSGQTLARWLVLEVTGRAPATVAQVARDLALARQSVQRVADLLEREGLAVYIDNPRHRRAKLLRLTPLGRAALDDIQARQRAWADVLGKRIGEQELRQASCVLDQVLSVLERSDKSRVRAEVTRDGVRPSPR